MIRMNTAKSKYRKQFLAGLAGVSIAMSGTVLANRAESPAMRHEGSVFGHSKTKHRFERRNAHLEQENRAAISAYSAETGAPRSAVKKSKPSKCEPCMNGDILSRDGWKLSSKGGLSYKNPKDQRYWFEISGIIRFDETIFSGSFRDKRIDFPRRANNRDPIIGADERYPSGGNVRSLEMYVESGLGENWLSMLGLSIAPGNRSLNESNRLLFNDTYVGYTGFAPNIEVDIGRLSGNWFGLDNSSSTSWNPFLERSLQANAFYMQDGVGVIGDIWWKHGQMTLLATQADHGDRIIRGATGELLGKNDRWKALFRASFAPNVCLGDVWHFGVSVGYKGFSPFFKGATFEEEGFRVYPGGRARNTPRLVDTGGIVAKYTRQWNVEAAKQFGPLILEGEYSEVYVRRKFPLPPTPLARAILAAQPLPYQGHVRFRGYNFQFRYLLTGEVHEYDARDGAFGKVNITSPYGAFEVAARYDFLNLNDKDVRGGSQHNVTVGLNWYITQEVRFSTNYIRAKIRQADHFGIGFTPRYLDIFGMRFQVRFR